jgi:hypothetical protein
VGDSSRGSPRSTTSRSVSPTTSSTALRVRCLWSRPFRPATRALNPRIAPIRSSTVGARPKVEPMPAEASEAISRTRARLNGAAIPRRRSEILGRRSRYGHPNTSAASPRHYAKRPDARRVHCCRAEFSFIETIVPPPAVIPLSGAEPKGTRRRACGDGMRNPLCFQSGVTGDHFFILERFTCR